MKFSSISFLLFIVLLLLQVECVAQADTVPISHLKFAIPFPKPTFPSDTSLVYDECIGETYHFFKPAEDWRRTTKSADSWGQLYKNPFIEDGTLMDQWRNENPVYYFKKGKLYNGLIQDTLDVLGHRANHYHYERNPENYFVFQVNCYNGLVNGIGTLHSLKSGNLVRSAYFEKGKFKAYILIEENESNKP
jgi:hypothetical protein